MKRLLLLAPAAMLAAFFVGKPASGQQAQPFGVLRSPGTSAPAPESPAPTPPPPAAGLPKGFQPQTNAQSAVHNPYPLTAEAGGWVICAAHYGGPDGFELARQVATILREKHRLPAFILDRGAEERAKQDAEWEMVKKRYPGAVLRRRMVRVENQFAVLVGGHRDFKEATAALPRFRTMPMPELRLEGGRNPYAELFYTEQAEDKKMAVKRSKINPFTQAMVVRNPRAPGAATRMPPDPFLVKLNEGEEYNLLKNPKKYTLAVKFYGGGVAIQSEAVREKENSGNGFLAMLGRGGSKQGEALAAGAAQANELARLLRHSRFGFDSYVMHTRTGSVVTVGGFTGPEDPAVDSMLRRLGSLRFNASGGADPIGLMQVPQMFEVPRF